MNALPFGDLPRSHFGVISADPAWKYLRYAPAQADDAGRRDADVHYDTMSLDDIKAMPVADLAARDCHLFLWTTPSFLEVSLEVMRAWGFRYSSMGFTWVKLRRTHGRGPSRVISLQDAFHTGMGKTTRKNAEFCLLGRKGSPKRLAADVRELIVSPVREHSRKPDEAFERIERYAPGPYLELFSRETRPGWSVWGNEVGKFDVLQAAE